MFIPTGVIFTPDEVYLLDFLEKHVPDYEEILEEVMRRRGSGKS
jgi:hypothetical protein